MSKSKKQSIKKMEKNNAKSLDAILEKDIKKFEIVFNSWPDDEKILYNRLHDYDKNQYAANMVIKFISEEYSFDIEGVQKKYADWLDKKLTKIKEEKESKDDKS
jgi:hypothetical protein